MVPSSLFLPVKIKVPMKTRFYIFSSFSRGTFSQNFTGSPSFHRFFYKFFQWLKLNFHDQKNLFSTGEITVFQWKAIFFGKGAWEYSALAIKIRFKNTRRLNFSRTQTIFKVVMLLTITGRNYYSRGVKRVFHGLYQDLKRRNPRENFFPSIYVRSSLNLGRVS